MKAAAKLSHVIYALKKQKFWVLIFLLVLSACLYRLQLQWGVQGMYYTNANWEGKPSFISRDNAASVRLADVHERSASRTFSVKWQGWIVIPETGAYIFATESDDGSFLSINETLVVDNRGVHGKRKATGAVFLEKGRYRFEMLYFTIGGYGMIDTFWTPPNKTEERLPTEHLFVKRPAWISFTLRKAVLSWFKTLKTPLILIGIFMLLAGPLLFLLKRAIRRIQAFFRSPSKQIFFSGVILICVIGAIEVCSFIFFTTFQEQFTFFDARQYLLSREQQEHSIKNIRQSGDQYLALGWDTAFSTPYGERPRKTSYNKPFLATFGDSFTYCDEVEHHQTWQTHLADFFTMDVYNFGICGYGTDQAYLKFLSVSSDIQTPIVMLGVTTENINRIVNVYRPFYFPRTSLRLTKPRFLIKDNDLTLLDNPIRSTEDMHKLGDPRFIQDIGQFDWWYNRDNYPILQFPYSTILLNKRMWLEVVYGKAERKVNDMDPRPWEDLWDEEEARAVMFGLFDAFVEHAQERHAIPVIVILPLQYQVRLKFQTREHESRVLQMMEYCQNNGYAHVETISALANSVSAEEEIRDLYVGHVSPQGNRIIAETLFQYLQQRFPEIITSRRAS